MFYESAHPVRECSMPLHFTLSYLSLSLYVSPSTLLSLTLLFSLFSLSFSLAYLMNVFVLVLILNNRTRTYKYNCLGFKALAFINKRGVINYCCFPGMAVRKINTKTDNYWPNYVFWLCVDTLCFVDNFKLYILMRGADCPRNVEKFWINLLMKILFFLWG